MNPKLRYCLLLLLALCAWLPQDAGGSIPRNSGGLQGLGGLEAVIGSDGVTRGIVNDWWGNSVGHVAAPGGAMTWSPAQFLVWGPAPGWGTPLMDGTKPLHELLGYRGLTVDPPGYVQQGLRAYDPQVGRWLSPDPVGHVGSLSLYDYCDNDPLNVFDPDGRFGKGVGNGITGSVSSSSPSSAAFNIGMTLGGGISGAGSGAVGGAHIVNNSLSLGLSDSFGWTQSYSYHGSQYTASRVLADVGRESLVAAAALGVGNALTTTTRTAIGTDRLVHVSTKADEILASGKLGLPSDIYAGPASNSGLSGWSLTAKTGLSPAGTYSAVPIPAAGEAAFSRVVPIGPMTAWQRLTGQQYTARGVIDLSTGAFTRSGVNWNQVGIYATDAAITGGVTGGGIYLWNESKQ